MARSRQAAPAASAGKPRRGKRAAPVPTATITESARQIWLAGLGAFNRAQAEGSSVFEALVRDGLSLEQSARRLAGDRIDSVRDVIGQQMVRTRDHASDALDRLESRFDEHLQRALVRLGTPQREELETLRRKVEALAETLHARNAGPAASGKTGRTAPRRRSPAAKPAVR